MQSLGGGIFPLCLMTTVAFKYPDLSTLVGGGANRDIDPAL